jgi:hypothetical protein
VDLNLDHRRKGLVWYPTYRCSFDGTYTIKGVEAATSNVACRLVLPTATGTYEDLLVAVDGRPVDLPTELQGALATVIDLGPGEERVLRFSYKTRGLGEWRYDLGAGIGRVRDLSLKVRTDFRAVDYPVGCLSPMRAEPEGDGMSLTWSASDLITRSAVGVIVPNRVNPAPLTSRITYFAPVCLIFFFILVAAIAVVQGINIHPMHYLFVAAGFFAFHLLLAYLADHVAIHAAFAASAAVSLALVTTYLSASLRGQFPWKVALGAQLFFLVLFSYSFFLEGMTGLVVAAGSVVTLAFLMRLTAHVDWDRVFVRSSRPGKAPAQASVA